MHPSLRNFFQSTPRLLLAVGLCSALLGTHLAAQQHTRPPTKLLRPPPPLPEDVRNSVPKSLPPDLPDPQELIGQLKQLDELLALSPDKLRKLKETIEHVEKMTPAERLSMRIRLSKITRMTPELKSEINEIVRNLQVRDRSSFTQFWLFMDDKQRQDIRSSIFSQPIDKQKEWLQSELPKFIQKRDAAISDD